MGPSRVRSGSLDSPERVAKYLVKPHMYMDEIYATMDCFHYRFFSLGGLLVCCGCGHPIVLDLWGKCVRGAFE